MGEIIISPWLVWLVNISVPILITSIVIAALGSVYLLATALIKQDEPIPCFKVIFVVMVVAYLNILLIPLPQTAVRIITANYVTVDTTNMEYEILTQKVSNILGVKIK